MHSESKKDFPAHSKGLGDVRTPSASYLSSEIQTNRAENQKLRQRVLYYAAEVSILAAAIDPLRQGLEECEKARDGWYVPELSRLSEIVERAEHVKRTWYEPQLIARASKIQVLEQQISHLRYIEGSMVFRLINKWVTWRERFSYEFQRRVIEDSELFDKDWYASSYPDIQSFKAGGIQHYIRFGWREGRNPSAAFDTKWYLATYPDVARANVNPLVHFIRSGAGEGRSGRGA